jgi:hypothetical protein
MVALGDQKNSVPVTPAAAPGPNDPPSGTVPAHARDARDVRDRRSPNQVERRSGMGRRRTDLVAGPWAAGGNS